MPKQTRSSRKPKRSATKSPKPSARRKFRSGTYVVPCGNVSLAVPSFWTLRQTNDDIELEAPGGETSVLVSAYQRQPKVGRLDAREYLQRLLATLRSNGTARVTEDTRSRAAAQYRDEQGDAWEAMFLSNGDTLLLATCSTHSKRTGKDAKIALEVLHSLKLKR